MVRSVYAATPFPLSGDVNGDGVVDVLDLRLVLERFFGGDVFADQNSDAVVNILDYGAVLARLGTVSASPSTSPSATPTATPVASPSPPPSGGSGEWSQHGGNAQHTSFVSQSVPTPWRLKWQWNGAGSDGKTQTNHLLIPNYVQPVTGGGRVYVVSTQTVYALDQSSTNAVGGSVLWTRSGIGTLSGSPAYDNDALFVPSSTGVYKLQATSGQVVASYTTAGSSVSITQVGNTLYVVTTAGNLLALNKDTMVKEWEYISGTTVAGGTSATYSYAKNLIVYLTSDLNVHAVNPQGTLVWKKKTHEPYPRQSELIPYQ
jgi:hypothetical protein